MKKNSKKILVVVSVAFLVGIAGILYTFFKPQRNIKSEKPAYIMAPISLYNEFSTNEDSSNVKYNDKVIQLSGTAVEFSLEDNGASVVFVNSIGGITCSFDSLTLMNNYDRISNIKAGDTVTLKGRCDGYDMIMGVVLSRCVLQ